MSPNIFALGAAGTIGSERPVRVLGAVEDDKAVLDELLVVVIVVEDKSVVKFGVTGAIDGLVNELGRQSATVSESDDTVVVV